MSLRQAKRQKLRRRILENGIALFRSGGFEATRVREIAERCEISEATFFNYFQTKDAVLGAWVCERLADDFQRAAAQLRGSLRPALRGLAGDIALPIEKDREFARCAWARVRLASFQPADGAVELVAAGQRSGELRRDVPAEELASILVAVTAACVASWLHHPELPEPRSEALGSSPEAGGSKLRSGPAAASLEPRLRRALDLVLDGSRRRHERVRPGSQPRKQPSGFASAASRS